jgi:citrate lyase subunit beta-like protein
MLRKSDSAGADTIVLDLEDSVADHQKGRAREAVYHKLNALARPTEGTSSSGRAEMAVRINPPSGSGSLAGDDLELLLPLEQLECVLLPKVESEEDVLFVISRAQQLRPKEAPPLSLVLSVESPASLFRMPTILDTVKRTAGISSAGVTSLLFASEDFCHTAGITRTRSRRELLFPRQQMALIAKAYGGLGAIDMVCIDYKDDEYLREECRDGEEIGYDGKQAVSGDLYSRESCAVSARAEYGSYPLLFFLPHRSILLKWPLSTTSFRPQTKVCLNERLRDIP